MTLLPTRLPLRLTGRWSPSSKPKLDDLRADRDHWRKAAESERTERLALSEKLMLTDQRPLSERELGAAATDAPAPANRWWARLFGRSAE